MGNQRLHADIINRAAANHCSFHAITTQLLYPREKQLFLNAVSSVPENLGYLLNNQDKRFNIAEWFPGTKSILICGFQYWNASMDENSLRISPSAFANFLQHRKSPRRQQPLPASPIISRYAFWQDYHISIRAELCSMLNEIRSNLPHAEGKVFVDTSPVSEKSIAAEAGLGWLGKNCVVVSKEHGSFFFIGGIALNLETETKTEKSKDNCGNCQLCVKACPTGALSPYRLNAGKCLSYWSTQHKKESPADISPLLEKTSYGCDICQQACPYNKKAATPVAACLKKENFSL